MTPPFQLTHLLLPLFAAALLGACASPLNRHTAGNYYQAGEQALSRGDFLQAREMFNRALVNTRLGHLGSEAESEVLKKLGRTYGNLCQYDEAEKVFLEAIKAAITAHGEKSTDTFFVRFEIAQFSYDIGRYEKAVQYFEQAFPFGLHILEKIDPPGYAAVMKDYADALTKTGRGDQAKEALAKAAAAESRIGKDKLMAASEYVRYPTSCK